MVLGLPLGSRTKLCPVAYRHSPGGELGAGHTDHQTAAGGICRPQQVHLCRLDPYDPPRDRPRGGGPVLDYVFARFKPRLERELGARLAEQVFVANPARAFAWDPTACPTV